MPHASPEQRKAYQHAYYICHRRQRIQTAILNRQRESDFVAFAVRMLCHIIKLLMRLELRSRGVALSEAEEHFKEESYA
jgi:hypothetical protein